MDDEQEITPDDVVDLTEIVPLTGVLRKAVMVAGDGDPPGSPLKRIPAGTPVDEIPQAEQAQLCQEHFD